MEGLTGVIQTLRRLVDDVQQDGGGLTSPELGGDVRELQLVISAATAVQTVRIAQYAAREEEYTEETGFVEVDEGLGHVSEFAGDDLAPMLGMAPSMAERRVHTSARLAASLPLTMRAMADGLLDPFRAQIIAEELGTVHGETRTLVEQMIHPAACQDTPGALRRRLRRALTQVDPEWVEKRAARARLERFVRVRAADVPGITEWWAQLPAEESAACWAAIDELAHRMKQDDPSRGIDQCRADALVDLILARAEVTTTVTFAVPVDLASSEGPDEPVTAEGSGATGTGPAPTDGPGASTQEPGGSAPAGSAPADSAPADSAPADSAPAGSATASSGSSGCSLSQRLRLDPDLWRRVSGCEIPGIGVIPSAVVAGMLERFDTRVSRLLVSSRTGVTVESGSSCYQPSSRIRAFVQARDGTCRFPGCRVRATRCQLDHVVPWPRGVTAPGNLICLCTHHHRLKTHTRWRPVLHDGGTVTWTDPFGQEWLTHPVDHLATEVA